MSRLGQAAPGTVDSPTVIDGGIAGGSALQQASQRRATADRLIAEARWLEALAADEQAMAAHLAELPPAYAVLHDLRLPGSKGNIDHVVIGPGGAFVVLTRRCSEAVVLRDGGLWAGDQSLSDVFNAARVESQLLTQSLLTPVVPVVALLDTRLPAATPGSLEGVLVCSGDRVVRVITRGSHTLLPPHLVGEVAERALPLLHNPGSVPRTESALGVRADPAPDTSVRPVVPPAVVWQRQGGGQGPATPKSTAASSAVPTRDPTPPTNESTGRARAFRFVAVALTLLCLIALAVGSLISFVWSGDEAADTSSPSQAVQSTSWWRPAAPALHLSPHRRWSSPPRAVPLGPGGSSGRCGRAIYPACRGTRSRRRAWTARGASCRRSSRATRRGMRSPGSLPAPPTPCASPPCSPTAAAAPAPPRWSSPRPPPVDRGGSWPAFRQAPIASQAVPSVVFGRCAHPKIAARE